MIRKLVLSILLLFCFCNVFADCNNIRMPWEDTEKQTFILIPPNEVADFVSHYQDKKQIAPYIITIFLIIFL